jgi:hypothetical protein
LIAPPKHRNNKPLALAVGLGVLTLLPTFYLPYVHDKVFYQAPIDWEWGLVLASLLLFLLLSECYKAFLRPSVVAWDHALAHKRKERDMHIRELVDGGEVVEKVVPKEGGKEGGVIGRVFRRETSSVTSSKGGGRSLKEEEDEEEEMKREEAAAVVEEHVM